MWNIGVMGYWYFQLCLLFPEKASASQYEGQVKFVSL